MNKNPTLRFYKKPTCGVCGKSINYEVETESILVENCGPPTIKRTTIHRCCEKIWRYEISFITEPPEDTAKEKSDERS